MWSLIKGTTLMFIQSITGGGGEVNTGVILGIEKRG